MKRVLALFCFFAALAYPAEHDIKLAQVDSEGGFTERTVPAGEEIIDLDSFRTALSIQPLNANLTSWAAITRASGFDAFTATPSSANLATLLTGETGSGAAVFGTSPTLTTPIISSQSAASATNWTAAGGSSGASLTLGQGANAVIALAPSGIGYVTTPRHFIAESGVFAGSTDTGIIGASGNLSFRTNGTENRARLTSTGNLLIGGTTDITGSGGLKVFGTTAATSTTSGAFQVVGGVGIGGAGHFGGDGVFGGDVTVSGGNVGVGGAFNAARGINVATSTLTGTQQIGVYSTPIFSSAATTAVYAGRFDVNTAVASFTVGVGYGVYVNVPTLGAGSAVTTLTGLSIQNQGAAGVTNAYGIDISAQTGAATTNIGLRNAGLTSLTNTTDATTGGAGSLTTAGGIYAAKKIVTSGDVEVADIGEGVIIKSPDGTRYRLTVANGGTLVITGL